MRSFSSRRRSSSPWSAECFHYEDGRHGDEDGRGGNEDGRRGYKALNTYLNIQARANFDLLQAILRELSFSIMSKIIVFQRQRNCIFIFPAYLILLIVNLSYFKEENCQTGMIWNFASNRKSAKQGLL